MIPGLICCIHVPVQFTGVFSDKKLLEEYITGASDEASTDSGTEDARDRQDSVLSAHLDVFRLDDVDKVNHAIHSYM